MFVLVTVGCIGVSWIAYQLNWKRQRREAIRSGAAVQNSRYGIQHSAYTPFGLSIVGERGQGQLFVNESQFERISRLFPEAMVLEYPVTDSSRISYP